MNFDEMVKAGELPSWIPITMDEYLALLNRGFMVGMFIGNFPMHIAISEATKPSLYELMRMRDKATADAEALGHA